MREPGSLGRNVEPADLKPGSEWLEAVITAGVRGFGGPPHGHESRWDFGWTLKTLDIAMQKHRRLAQYAAEMSPTERDAVWADPSPEAEAMRRVMRCR